MCPPKTRTRRADAAAARRIDAHEFTSVPGQGAVATGPWLLVQLLYLRKQTFFEPLELFVPLRFAGSDRLRQAEVRGGTAD